MPRKFSDRFREPDLVTWSDTPGLALAFGVALLVGLGSGVVWVAWNVFKHWLR